MAFCCGLEASAAQVKAVLVPTPPLQTTNRSYTANRSPLAPAPFLKLPIGSIQPRGWLRKQLEIEAKGMTGKLEEISRWCKFENSAWASTNGQGKYGWEELPYWLKGYGDLGYVLGDEKIIENARRWIDATLASQEPDGFFGPRENKTSLDGHPDLWPHMVMLNVLQSFYEYSSDERVLPFMSRYLRWLNSQPPATFGRGYWPKLRFGDTIESAHWLYSRTGEAFLLDLGRKIHENMARWDQGVIDWHNVNIAQGFREPAVYFVQAQEPRLLYQAETNYQQVMSLYGQFPGGGFAGDENCRRGYDDPRQGFETCGIVEFMHSFEMLTRISGHPVWADRCEELAFNSLPAAMTPDQRALHYLTAANQVQLDTGNKAPAIQNSGNMFAYSPLEVYRCCQHNVSHGWPYFAEELWLATPDNGLCASLYSASKVTAKVGSGQAVTITETTDYPFSDIIRFEVASGVPVNFPVYLRVPGWCEKPMVSVNGKMLKLDASKRGYVRIEKEWTSRDTVVLQLPMQVKARRWSKNHNAASIDYGPLTFSLLIGERWARSGGTERWPEHEVYPTTPWNYALVLNDGGLRKLKPERRPMPDQPFTPQSVPLRLQLKARRLPEWQLDRFGLAGKLQDSPVLTSEPVENITLIPMGAARLRITSFPVATAKESGHRWTTPQQAPLTASHCFEGDSLEALVDEFDPASSDDTSIPRFTWWNHKGTAEWIQFDLPAPKTISGVGVYWFDDTSKGGGCRLPASWSVEYNRDGKWHAVANSGAPPEAAPNTLNTVEFTPVTTTSVRIAVKLQPGFSAGILSLKVQ